jgi:4-hydroxybenzoyl-CoA reductase alpha subunit
MAEFSIIGKRISMVDGPAKVTGGAKYTDDLTLPGMLHGKVLRSPHPHARIVRLDTSQAAALPGVIGMITGADVSRQYGILPVGHDETALAVDKVRYIGEGVAAIAAVSAEIAEEALELIEVEYEVLPAAFDPEQAMRRQTNWIHADKPYNIEKEYHHHFGDVEAGFREADVVREDRFTAEPVTHAAMEPHGTLASYEPSGKLTVWSSTQTPYYLQLTLARVLDLPTSQIRVIVPFVGGGFGGKDEPLPHEICAAALAGKVGRPVKITCSREEVFYLHRGRPHQLIDLKTGITRDGRIIAVECRVIQGGGAYCSYGVVTILYAGALLAALYDIRNIKYDGHRVLTNKPPCGAMRGHGTVNVRFAFESQLDMLAEAIGMDPVEIRQRNLLTPHSRTVNALRVTSYGYPECLRQVVEQSRWSEKRGKLPFGKGIGIAGSHYVSGAANSIIRSDMPHSTVLVKVDHDTTVTIFTGTAEIGQGCDTMQAQVVAEELGVGLEQVHVVAADSDVTPVDLGSYSSRVTFMAGNAALQAAREVKRQLLSAVSEQLGVASTDLGARAGKIFIRNDPSRAVSFAQAVSAAQEMMGGTLMGAGSYAPPPQARGGKFKGAGVGPGPAYSYSAQVAEVTVDPGTGRVTVDRVIAAHDCGRALNPLTVEG